MERPSALVACVLMLPLLGACAGNAIQTRPAASGQEKSAAADYPTVERAVAGCAEGEPAFDCDRRAILAMAGNYLVRFNFDETVVLQPGYERRAPKRSGAFEQVVLVEDAGRRISLQHILVMGDKVTKHWRQDWVYEAAQHWVYVGGQRFEARARNAETIPGTWTQLVYEVNDAPRYAGDGKWNHRYGVSTWTSERSWRPLPRREYTTRDDYQLINAENRHTIGPQGWTHEQDNTKVVRKEQGKDTVLVREFGFNEYRRIEGFDFGAAETYWRDTAEFWARIRARWDSEFNADGSLRLSVRPGDEAFNKAILETADDYRKDPRFEAYQARLDDIFRRFVNVGHTASLSR
ncbi:DUF6607 family protein [Nitrosovibrio sp. Nv17]|uniref:DUF6607 family protein n=1 Tax=Nitrosovibrio sp. Nv17 TaxID=1855339 RepID=UPI000908B995|nr:DUF6607 family protein [Nitrosovibrio sp. Nv17]SFW33558.1 hypothetical protein SAMN05216414_11924 [Nitrosovibrio sp. Nv17]